MSCIGPIQDLTGGEGEKKPERGSVAEAVKTLIARAFGRVRGLRA